MQQLPSRPSSLCFPGEDANCDPLNRQIPDPPTPYGINDDSESAPGSSTRARSETINQQVLFDGDETSGGDGPSCCKSNNESANIGRSSSVDEANVSTGARETRSASFADQEFKATLRERNARMYLNSEMADVQFLVGLTDEKELIPAHSYVLATASSVFQAMFHGGFDNPPVISVPDVDADSFKVMLRYLYTDDIQLSLDNALPVLYVARKYLIVHLYKEAIKYLEKQLDAENVCTFLSQGQLFSDEMLAKRCWEVVDAQTEKVLQSDNFLSATHEVLVQILSRSTLNVNERIVYERTIQWAVEECERRNLASSPESVRLVLGDAFYLIRLTEMSVDEFANGPASSDYITAQEKTDIFLWFLAKLKPTLRFITQPRAGLPIHICHRYRTSAYRSNQWRYRGRCDGIQFSVDRRIFIAGYGFYGSSNGASQYKVKMELKKANEVMAVKESHFSSDGSSQVYLIMFDEPIQIEAGVVYTALALIDGKELSYFGQEGHFEINCPVGESGSVTFSFSSSVDSRNGTGVQGGQIPQILFYA